jgi:hypothetical protein
MRVVYNIGDDTDPEWLTEMASIVYYCHRVTNSRRETMIQPKQVVLRRINFINW